MNIGQYQVGQKPARPIALEVRDTYGRAVDLSFYDEYKVLLIGSDNEEVDLGNSELQTGGARTGRFTFVFPTDRSLFDKTGDYFLQLELSGDGHRDFTTAFPIRVREVGRDN